MMKLDVICNRGGLLISYGLDAPEAFNFGEVYEITSTKDGKVWQVRTEDGFFWYAKREPTQAEAEILLDRENSMQHSSFFSLDRKDACHAIACELWEMISINPDMKMPRSQRRANRKRADALLQMQIELMMRPRVDMISVRKRLAEVGLPIQQFNSQSA